MQHGQSREEIFDDKIKRLTAAVSVAHDFSSKVDALVEEQYGIADGGDLCYSLIEMGVIDMAEGEFEAARIVAQYIEQA